MLLGNPFYVDVKGTSVTDCTSLVCSLINVADSNRRGKFFSGESMFPDKLPVNTRDIRTRIYQCGGVDDFEGAQEGDQLYRNTHRFVQSGYKYRGACYKKGSALHQSESPF